MAQYNPLEVVFCGDNRQYYSYDEELYTGTFPTEWAKTHLFGTGPKECKNCESYGMWNGVFVGYCANCALFVYNGERGRGLMGLLKENTSKNAKSSPSIFETYLKGVDLHKIGDKDFMDSAQMLKEVNAYYDECRKIEEARESRFTQGDLEWYVDRAGTGSSYGSNYDGGYDSF